LEFDMLRTLVWSLKEHPTRTKLFKEKQFEKGSAHTSLGLAEKETLVRFKVLSAGRCRDCGRFKILRGQRIERVRDVREGEEKMKGME